MKTDMRLSGLQSSAWPVSLASRRKSALAEADSFKVRFKPGAESARYNGSIQGYDDDTYIIDARRGQEMTVNLRTSNPQAYFNILPPGSDVAIYNGSIEGNRYTGVLPRSGKYRIVVYMMRAAARRDEVADYRLSVAIPAEDAGRTPPMTSPMAMPEVLTSGSSRACRATTV